MFDPIFLHPPGMGVSSLFIGFMLGTALAAIGVVAARLGSRGPNLRLWTIVHALVLIYSFGLFFVAMATMLLVQPGPFGVWAALAGLLSGLVTLSQGHHLWRRRREEEERRMFAHDL